ncbi:Zinc finger protein [Plakobranchus ocellatus]|uniref:Zinc finger protein n=1 Tax=Plakobranchus ocellatus TaxID=259542 RepID=A0AAV4CUZ9_9GAST|nr:Zinc finger protein [Plakobranchus ocellatus]
MADVVDLVSDDEPGDDAPGPTRAELKPSVCSQEATWFSQLFPSPDDQVIDSSIPKEQVEAFQDLIWNKPHDRMVPGYGMTPKELASVSSEGRRGWLVTSHFYWLSRCINHQQNHTKFYVFDPTIRKASIDKLLPIRTASQIKQIVFVLSVGRQDDGIVFLGTDKVPGDHWSMAVVDIHTGVLTYCDTLGWPLPIKFLPSVVRYTSCLGLTSAAEVTVRMAHQINHEQHICTEGCTNYPLQTCSDVCGIITMVCVAIAALDKKLFELLLKPQQANLYLTDPTQFSTYLRHVVLYWLAMKHIDMSRISLKPSFNALADLPSINKAKLGVKRKTEVAEVNGSSTPYKRKFSRTKSSGNIDQFILKAVDDRISPSELVQEAVELFTPHAKTSLESLNREMLEFYEGIVFNEAIERHRDDGLSLKSYVKEFIEYPMANPVIMFKNQGKEMKTLEKDDTILAVQTPFQREMMKTYGQKCMCVDLTQRKVEDKFHLYTVLVFVEGEVEVPVAWLITNRNDNLVLNLFFKTLKLNVGTFQTEIFIGDIGSCFHKAWSLHFPKPEKRMHSVWETFNVVSSRLNSFVSKEEERIKIKRFLNIIPLITDKRAIHYYLSALYEVLEPHADFKEYFRDRYVSDCKIEFWASCYRNIPSSQFIPFLRPFDKTLQHLGLHGAGHPFSRVDVLLHKLLQLSRFLEYKVHIQTSETRLLKASKSINLKHSNSPQGLDIYTSASGDAWHIHASAETNSFSVLDTGSSTCSCQVYCSSCNFCVHRYACSCPDFLLNPGGCGHIHSIHSFRKMNEVLNNHDNLSRPSLLSGSTTGPSESTSSGQQKTLGAELNAERLKRQVQKDLNSFSQHLQSIQDTKKLQIFSEALKTFISQDSSTNEHVF